MLTANNRYHDDMVEQINAAISRRLIIEFNYSDSTRDKVGIRILEPYLLGINKQGKLFVSGYFRATEEQVKDKMVSDHKNYLFENIAVDSLKVSSEKFTSLNVKHPDKIYKTTTTIVQETLLIIFVSRMMSTSSNIHSYSCFRRLL